MTMNKSFVVHLRISALGPGMVMRLMGVCAVRKIYQQQTKQVWFMRSVCDLTDQTVVYLFILYLMTDGNNVIFKKSTLFHYSLV